MKAKLQPLESKYYGTIIELDRGTIKIWNCGGRPSDRQIEAWGITPHEWDNNILVQNGWGGLDGCRNVYKPEDSHYETQADYLYALELIKIINNEL